MQSETNTSNNFVAIEDIMGLLEEGFFDCDEEILQQVNSLESDVSFVFYSSKKR